MIGAQSIRIRVLSAMAIVVILTMTIAGIVVDRTFAARERDALTDLLNQSISFAEQLADEPDMTAATMVDQLAAAGVPARVVLADGSAEGPKPSASKALGITLPLNGVGSLQGATITVWHGTGQLRDSQAELRRALLMVGILSLLGASLLTVLVTDLALKPLHVMAHRARQISDGERGIRMAAPNSATEVGVAASAIDSMLDELEGAERRARTAEVSSRRSADQMQSFLSDAAHELKTPLAGIQAAAESLMELSPDAVAERNQLAFLLAREANRGGHLVNSLLESARVDAGVQLNREPLDLVHLVEAEKQRMALSQPGVDVVITGSSKDVEGDRHALTSVLRNLVDNAGRAALPDGWVMIDLADRPAADGLPEMAVVTVMDSGPGIVEADRERVFRRLVRLASTATTTKGSGLGLAIARGYARAHGGDITYVEDPHLEHPSRHADGSPRVGACFEVTLPLTSG